MGTRRIKLAFGMLAVLLTTLVTGSLVYADGTGPMSPFPITGAFTATSRADRDHISIIEFGGSFRLSIPEDGVGSARLSDRTRIRVRRQESWPILRPTERMSITS